MKFKRTMAPHINHPESTRKLMFNVLITLLVLYGMAFFYYGIRALVLGAVSVTTALLTDWICRLIFKRKVHLRDLSAVVTGLIIPLIMPASIPFYVPVIAAVFAIAVVKHPFGGVGYNIFNPAAAGVAFVTVSFPALMFTYPLPRSPLPLFPPADLVTVSSPGLTLMLGGTPPYDLISMALGKVPGPMGATNILVLLACLLFLISRGTLQWDTPVFFLLTSAAISFYFPRINTTRTDAMLYELMSGILLFGAVFMLGDPVTRPKREWANVIYGVVAAILVMVFRRVGNIEEEFLFALLLMNALVWPIDAFVERLARKQRRKHIEAFHR